MGSKYLWTFFHLCSIVLSIHGSTSSPQCRCFPGDTCWPTAIEWAAFNKTIAGRLIATKPIGSLCYHDTEWKDYSAQKCAELKSNWGFPQIHVETAHSIPAPWWANASCDPFAAEVGKCELGTYIRYAVNATGADDYLETIRFVKKHNIRLVIRNTGHDYLGKSTGANALGLWTHNLKDIEFIDYKSDHYTGKAMKVGAGVQVFEANAAAHAKGLVVVGGDCQTVGLAGGYTQGGGHSFLASIFGLAADQVLEWEVVTAEGKLLTATTASNSDLYWALSGGGGGTYGVVLSMVVRAHADFPMTSTANLTFNTEGISKEAYYEALEAFIEAVPQMVDAGVTAVWMFNPTNLMMWPAIAPGIPVEKLQEMLNPVTKKLKLLGLRYCMITIPWPDHSTRTNWKSAYNLAQYPSYLEAITDAAPSYNVTQLQLGGRFVPQSLISTNSHDIVTALRNISRKGGLLAAVTHNVAKRPGAPENSVNPVWRDATFLVVLGTPIPPQTQGQSQQEYWKGLIRDQKTVTEELVPELTRLTPNGGAYLNEADPNDPHWKQVFYGENYDRLKAIKDKYDPNGIFYGHTAVGSDEWTVKQDGRLCRVAVTRLGLKDL